MRERLRLIPQLIGPISNDGGMVVLLSLTLPSPEGRGYLFFLSRWERIEVRERLRLIPQLIGPISNDHGMVVLLSLTLPSPEGRGYCRGRRTGTDCATNF